jgi:hypothetical protein
LPANHPNDQPRVKWPALEIVLRLAFQLFGNGIQNHETARQQTGAPVHHPDLKSELTENFATSPFDVNI